MSNTVTIEINPLNISKILLNHSLSFTDLKTKQTIDIDSPSVFNDLYNKYGALLMNVSLEEASKNNYPITNNNPNNLNITYGDTYVEGPKSLTASLLVKDYLDPEIDSRYYASNSDDAKSIDDIIKDYRDYYGCSLLEACQLFAAKANWNYHKDMFYRYNWKDGKSIKTTYGDKLWEQMQQDLRQIADVDSGYLDLAADPQNAIKTSMKLYDEVSKLLPKGAKPFTLKHDIPLNNFRAFDWYDNEIKLNTLNDFRNVHKFEPKIVTSSNLLEYLNNASKVDYYPTTEELLQLSDLLNTNSSILKNVNFTYEHLPLQIRKILGDIVSRDGVNTGWVFNSKNKTFYKLNPTDMSDVLIKMLMPDALGTIIDYKLNPERLKATLLGMGWDDNALNEYVLELYTLLNPRKVHLEIGNSFENPNIPMGKASGRIVGSSPEWDIMLNRAISGDPLMLFELYLHEIGGHLATGSVASNRQKLILLFPRTYEVIQHNNLLLKNTLYPNDFANKVRMPIYLLVQDLQKRGLTDDEIEDLIPIMQADQKRLEYRISEQEGLARVHAANMSDLKFPGTVSLNENLLRHYFSPESIDKLKKAILSVAIPISVGYGVNQNNKNN